MENKKGKQNNNSPMIPFSKEDEHKAFTLVELIVTITILAILWTIGFLSFQSYTVYSRDVVRLSHISNMKSVLEYNYTETWRYPKPDWENNITYSWAIAWIQWDFWKDTKRKTKRLDSIPLDPLTQNTYSYSVTKNQSEFELGSIFEWDEVSKNNNILNNSYADNWDFKAYISWNYNWQILKVQTGWLDYILAVPSIILSDYTDLRLEDIIDNANSKFVLNWYKNIPSNYGMSNSNSGELDFLKKENFVVFEWDLESLSESWSLQEELWTKLALAYSWTTIENNSWIKEIVNAHINNKPFLIQNTLRSTIIPKIEITAKVNYNNCLKSEKNWYIIPQILDWENISISKSEIILKWSNNSSALASCIWGIINITNENINITCDNWYTDIWWSCHSPWNIIFNWTWSLAVPATASYITVRWYWSPGQEEIEESPTIYKRKAGGNSYLGSSSRNARACHESPPNSINLYYSFARNTTSSNLEKWCGNRKYNISPWTYYRCFYPDRLRYFTTIYQDWECSPAVAYQEERSWEDSTISWTVSYTFTWASLWDINTPELTEKIFNLPESENDYIFDITVPSGWFIEVIW